MKVIVNKHDLRIIKDEDINEKESNIQTIDFEFSKDYEGFQKNVLFTDFNNKTKKIVLNDNTIEMPCFEEEQSIILGVYAEKIIDDKLYRLNPTPKIFYIEKGSLRDAENHKEITPTEFEQYMQLLKDGLDKIPATIEEKLKSLDLGNLNLDNYVKKEEGKGLSSNDFTNDNKLKLDSLNNYDDTSIRKNLEILDKKIEEVEKIPGTAGKDGVGISNITSNEDSSLTITLSNGSSTTTAPLKGLDGKDGEQGIQGPPGRDGIDGINGQDGYTPQPGIDYSSKQEIQEYCKTYIDKNYLSLLGGSY